MAGGKFIKISCEEGEAKVVAKDLFRSGDKLTMTTNGTDLPISVRIQQHDASGRLINDIAGVVTNDDNIKGLLLDSHGAATPITAGDTGDGRAIVKALAEVTRAAAKACELDSFTP